MSVVSPDFDFEARLPLLQKLDQLYNGVSVSIDFWAMAWMSDLGNLTAFVNQLESTQDPMQRLTSFSLLSSLAGNEEESPIFQSIVRPCEFLS